MSPSGMFQNEMPQSGVVKTVGMLTLDVEDWEHANFTQLDSQGEKISELVKNSRYAMDRNTDRWIRILGEFDARSTCFVLGEFAARYPEAVRRLAQAGHEIASHGATHDLIYRMNQGQFREYLKRGLGILGDLLGRAPKGFRAPSWSVDPVHTPWLIEELEAQGVRYDSSLFPVQTPLFGHGNAPLRPYWERSVLRVPVTVLTWSGFRLPFSSGAFFRLAPLAVIRFGFKRAARQGLPLMTVLHPRELDPAHPRLPLEGWERAIHYARLQTTEPKLRSILAEFQWHSIQDLYGSKLDTPGSSLENFTHG